MNNPMWFTIRATAVLISLLAFTPLVISPNKTTPPLLGVPYTLWVGIAISISLIVLIILGAIFSPSNNGGDTE